jgi:hypothetical protein
MALTACRGYPGHRCPSLVPRGRCIDCARVVDAQRGRRQQRGYGAHHDALREAWSPAVEAGRVKCWRCQVLIKAGSAWHLGHDDDDRTKYRGPEHMRCNLSAAGKASHAE